MKNEKETYNNLNNIPDKAWEDLSKKSFYFGHQSVGYNIIDGIRDILKENPKIKLNIIETTDASAIAPGVFAHSRIGKNTQPKTKIDDFAKYINSGVGKKADTAAMKLCYVDINENTDTTELFSQYEAEIAKIHKAYPNLTIVHFTAPLRTLQTGPKAWIKKVLGKPVWGVKENIKRDEYNELLRNTYQGKEPILDLAQIESTLPDGTSEQFEYKDKSYPSLVPAYTNDGGHLNELGRKKVAEQLLLLLVNL